MSRLGPFPRKNRPSPASACHSSARISVLVIPRAEPGGDAHDPHLAALTRLLEEGWARRLDKDRQVEIAMPDVHNWKRVRFRGIEHFVGFRYGKAHHALIGGFVVDMPDGARVTSERCLRRFETWARPQARYYDVQLEPIESGTIDWQGQQLVVHQVEGHVTTLLSRRQFSAAWTAYPAYPDACLVVGMAAQWREHPDKARAVRKIFVDFGLGETKIRTEHKPYRHETP